MKGMAGKEEEYGLKESVGQVMEGRQEGRRKGRREGGKEGKEARRKGEKEGGKEGGKGRIVFAKVASPLMNQRMEGYFLSSILEVERDMEEKGRGEERMEKGRKNIEG